MRVEEFNEVRVVGAVGNGFVRKKLFSSPVNLHDNGLTKQIAFTPFREHVVETPVQDCIMGLLPNYRFSAGSTNQPPPMLRENVFLFPAARLSLFVALSDTLHP